MSRLVLPWKVLWMEHGDNGTKQRRKSFSNRTDAHKFADELANNNNNSSIRVKLDERPKMQYGRYR